MNNYAYVTFLSNSAYAYYVLALYDSWKQTNSAYPFYCVCTEDVQEAWKAELKKLGINILDVDASEIKQAVKDNNDKMAKITAFQYATMKLCIFNLTQFDKLIYLDSDMIITENIDHLFEKEDFSAVEDRMVCSYKDKSKYFLGQTTLNGGLLVFTPSKKLYNQYLDFLKNPPEIPEETKKLNIVLNGWNDQAIMAYFNQNWINEHEKHLSQRYNFLLAVDTVMRYQYLAETAAVIHYAGDKYTLLQEKPLLLPKSLVKYWYDYYVCINRIIIDNNLNIKLLRPDLIYTPYKDSK